MITETGNEKFKPLHVALRTRAMGFGSFLKDKTSAAAQTARQTDWQGRMRGAAEQVSTTAKASSQWSAAYFARTRDAATEGIRRMTGSTLAGVCKHEASTKPCPRLLLVCCTALVTSGLETEALFKREAPTDLVNFLLGSFEEGSGVVLPPPGSSPHVLANAIKAFLITMPEPLLTYKLVPEFIRHGSTVPTQALATVQELPAPNQNALQLLLETFHRVSGNAAVNEMDAQSIAEIMAPCIAWHPPPKGSQKASKAQSGGLSAAGGSRAGPTFDLQSETSSQGDGSPMASSLARVELGFPERQAIARVLEQLIVAVKSVDGTSANSPLYYNETSI